MRLHSWEAAAVGQVDVLTQEWGRPLCSHQGAAGQGQGMAVQGPESIRMS